MNRILLTSVDMHLILWTASADKRLSWFLGFFGCIFLWQSYLGKFTELSKPVSYIRKNGCLKFTNMWKNKKGGICVGKVLTSTDKLTAQKEIIPTIWSPMSSGNQLSPPSSNQFWRWWLILLFTELIIPSLIA